MTPVDHLPRMNPFSTRFVQPGVIPFRFPTPDGLAAMIRRLHETSGWGEIVGPHGSGKSTLLASLLPALTAWQVHHIRLNATHRTLSLEAFESRSPGSILVIDGFEQLGIFTRWRLKRHCRRNRCGLLVTAHRSMGLPQLRRTDVTHESAAELIRSLLPTGGDWVLTDFDIAARLRHHRGSLREVLFELYDRWEQ
ncbi:MAG: hypothetical protein K8U57_40460 [Planctomycetes bacterium]|nr:hypothetical protein [Planctomycetota bacterium]